MSTTARHRWDGWTEPDDPAWVRDVHPILPADLMTPDSPCPHKGPVEPGSLDYCVVCHASGRDGDPALKIDPRTAPKPEPVVDPEAEKPRTRKQRRAKLARSA